MIIKHIDRRHTESRVVSHRQKPSREQPAFLDNNSSPKLLLLLTVAPDCSFNNARPAISNPEFTSLRRQPLLRILHATLQRARLTIPQIRAPLLLSPLHTSPRAPNRLRAHSSDNLFRNSLRRLLRALLHRGLHRPLRRNHSRIRASDIVRRLCIRGRLEKIGFLLVKVLAWIHGLVVTELHELVEGHGEQAAEERPDPVDPVVVVEVPGDYVWAE